MAHVTGDGTVGKALEVLDQVAAFGRPVRFSELLAQSPFPKPTLYRFVQTLTNQRMLAYDPDRQTYTPGLRLVRLAHAAWEQSTLAPIARPHIEALSSQVGETVHLAQLDHAHVLYVDKVNAAQPVEMYSQAGKIGPAYCTGVGKTMLAFIASDRVEECIAQQSFHIFTPHTLTGPEALREELRDIRTRGYGFDREEHEPGIICVAMPILSESGRVHGAISVTSTTERNDLAGLEAQVPLLRETATSISRDIHNWSFPDHDKKQATGG
ncbi:IclR family transcriptional regulator [Yoonia sediminilitoris]|uniref:IclR family transcriptional regulator n=1 Tax=Yoonia sediminilitoris TaxID=1286148 RepID=A0A2T6K7P5_9RHOB|nr:IclR family transcriptional regulator [Yoonia sediminilitoris]PUB10693.1 IclR family transcriptional regulator [Yoonia sediminilitoris]RCW90445.1 IclR family transcriptional regulator [Yoonia sediminilitoris]